MEDLEDHPMAQMARSERIKDDPPSMTLHRMMALQVVRDGGLNGTALHLIYNHPKTGEPVFRIRPVFRRVWRSLRDQDLVHVHHGRLFITALGRQALQPSSVQTQTNPGTK